MGPNNAKAPNGGVKRCPFEVRLSLHVIILTTIFSAALAYATGWACRNFLLEPRLLASLPKSEAPDGGGRGGVKPLPQPVLLEGKTMPETKYTSQVFEVKAVRTTHNMHIRQPDTWIEEGQNQCGGELHVTERHVSFEGSVNAARLSGETAPSPASFETEEEEHLPAGQHLLVDIKNVDPSFLNSEDRLGQALVDVIEVSKLTLLSYHCHSLLPAGVSCVGVLLESHISFHTWPEEGVITLDLFTCGNEPLLPAVPVIESLFALPRREGAGANYAKVGDNATAVDSDDTFVEPPRMLWSHVNRGFRPHDDGLSSLKDLSYYMLMPLQFDYKKEIASAKTKFQRIDIYDEIQPRFNSIQAYERSLRTDVDTYESRHPELFRPNRVVFMDGMIQSSSDGDEAYHEALVHPAMFVHEWAERVAIIGGGEGATLREVLKHDSVEHVKMIEIDEFMVKLSREHLPSWSDCSDLVGSADSCFDDERAEVLYEDAFRWFIDRFKYPCDCENGKEAEKKYCECLEGDESSTPDEEEDEDDSGDDEDSSEDEEVECFDVIFMDALDPETKVDFSSTLFNEDDFVESLYGALCEDGILVIQLGESPVSVDPPEHFSEFHNRASLMASIEELGFESIQVYEESHCGFKNPWSFMVACKSYECRWSWYSSEPQMEVLMNRWDRLRKTHSGESPLKYFDSATMKTYQVPPKVWETVFCRSEPAPEGCNLRGYNPYIDNYRIDEFEVKMSSLGEGAGRGMFAKVDIPEGSYVAQEDAHTKLHFDQWSVDVMEGLAEKLDDDQAEDIDDVLRYMYGYGFQHVIVADYEYYVDSGIMTFVNHGCNGTNNMMSEAASDAKDFSEEFNPDQHHEFNPVKVGAHTFNPAMARHLPHLAGSFDVTGRDINAGEEMLTSYATFIASKEDWEEEMLGLRSQCRGEVIGDIKQWEGEEDEEDEEDEAGEDEEEDDEDDNEKIDGGAGTEEHGE